MKKTLITLLVFAGMAPGAVSETLTLSSPAHNQQAGYSAFDFVLSSTYLTPTITEWAAQQDRTEMLTGITLTPAATWYRNSVQGAGLAIYQKSANAELWSYIGRSDWQKDYTINGSTTLTFNFNSLELKVNDKYTVVIYAKEDAFNALNSDSTLTSLLGLENPTDTNPIAVMGMRSVNGANDDFTMYSRDSRGNLSNPPQSPCVTFDVTPEPATATLSLLALAGLASRRRRH